ncbi:Autophagy-related protein 22-1 [Rhynchospora pubera]|uniref:Autophagy-related protein 22-1 n=1 Tax=Rhynchospora pubera TaxID=906938 RepID=A0AAV8GXD6_9POAL|nr:Autophagy-related protein 22-1 [Rhynchospora pubera]
MGKEELKDMSSTKAVFMGALASGVNGPTWFVLKVIFLLLGVSLTAMFALAFSSSDFVIVAHVTFLVFIGAVLFVLLSGFLAQTGLVSVEQQMEEIGLLNTTEEVKKEK